MVVVLRLIAELPLLEAVEDHVNVSEGARAVLKCRIKSSQSDTDIDIRWFHNASPVDTADQFIIRQSMYTNSFSYFFLVMSTPLSRPNKVGLKCPFVRPSVGPSIHRKFLRFQ